MSEPEIRFLEVPFQRLTVAPDEVIVIQHPGRLTSAQHARMAAVAREVFGTRRVTVLDQGMTIEAVKVEGQDGQTQA